MKKIFIFVFFFASICYNVEAQENDNGIKAAGVATSLSEMYDWNLYPSYQTYLDFMNYYADTYPNYCKLDTIGYTLNNRLLLALKISSDVSLDLNKPKFFYSSSMHGDELTGSVILMHLIDTLLSSQSNDILALRDALQIYICPLANPDGTYFGGDNNVSQAIRYNANYVDLNRNYPDIRAGIHPDGEAYQVENIAFMNYATREKFNMSCNLHGGAEVVNFPFDTYRSSQKTHADDSWFRTMGTEFVNSLSNASNYFVDVTSSGITEGGDWYVITGSRQDWHTYFAHCREVTLEISTTKTPSQNTLPRYWNYLKQSVFTFPLYCLKGFEGVVKDSITRDNLNDVMISINNHDRDSSEVFTNNNGYFFRPILAGEYSVTFSKQGYYDKTINISASGNLTNIGEIELVAENYNSLVLAKENSIKIFPVPASDLLNIELEKDMEYMIADLQLKILKKGVLKKGNNLLDISFLNEGSYTLVFFDKNESISKQIIVVK